MPTSVGIRDFVDIIEASRGRVRLRVMTQEHRPCRARPPISRPA
jgi:hypothetical protein